MAKDVRDIDVSVNDAIPSSREHTQVISKGDSVPISDDLKSLLRVAAVAVKSEIVIHEIRNAMYWQSISELALILAGLMLAVIHGDSLIWLNALHMSRAILGYWLFQSLPETLSFLDDLPDDLNLISKSIMTKASISSKKAVRPLAYYALVTCLALILDLIGLTVNIAEMDQPDNVYVVNVVLCWVFLCYDLYLPFWYNSLKKILPHELISSFTLTFVSFETTDWKIVDPSPSQQFQEMT